MEIKFGDISFKKICEQAISSGVFHPFVLEILDGICNDKLSIELRDMITAKYLHEDIGKLKRESIKFLLYYVDAILKDDILTQEELANLKLLKMIFKIKQGDFYRNHKSEIQILLNKQLRKIYEDKKVDYEEAVYSVSLQELFDLSYDQYEELSEDEIRQAVERGANLDDLDTTLKI
ncbi:hypothetical protein [Chryseobacterium koreense]|mgnify:CR=1 FL=1|uniref:hypothetical protein n=1 Tax=Chryseobacterium koreense TaxID=232216 RepID=UPI0026F1B89E|nr:hypothetical protein [Chryseobacterium koreense]